ncbi:MAG TPA: RsiV family protein [Chitinophagales bacterium]|nr:RsiV family protein [Chitinophagales bacterium]
MRIIILLLFILQCFSGNAQQEGVIKKFSGTIGKAGIVADIKIIDTTFSGSYYYVKEMNPLLLRGTLKNSDITAIEEVNDSITGSITGKMNGDHSAIKGTWQNSSGKKSYPFEWKVTQQEGSAVLNVISKQYNYVWNKNKNGDELGCKTFYSLCYIIQLSDLQAKKLINDELLQADVDLTANDDDLKEAATEYMDDDSYFYKEDFDTAYAEANTAENEQWINASPQLYQWKKSQTCDVIFNENNLLALQIYNEEITGGSHRSLEYIDMVFDLKTGMQLGLDELFKPGYHDPLNELAKLRLLSKFKAGSLQQLEEKGLQLHGGFEVSDNFFIQKNGIVFTYNPNEIAPNSTHAIEIIIPWSSLQQWINPSGPLAWTLKK